LDTNPPLPLEFRLLGYKPQKFVDTDFIAMIKLMSRGLAMNAKVEIVRLRLMQKGIGKERLEQLMPNYPASAPIIVKSHDFTWSNNSYDPIVTTPISATTSPEVQSPASSTPQPPNSASSLLKKRLLDRSARASNNWVVSGRRTVSGNYFFLTVLSWLKHKYKIFRETAVVQ